MVVKANTLLDSFESEITRLKRTMESEERPAKIRKLSPGRQDHIAQSSASIQPVEDDANSDKEQTSFNATEEDDSNDQDDKGKHLQPSFNAAAPIAETNANPADPPLSKNQQKKLRKKQEWESKREERKVIRKEKIAAKRDRKREQRRKEVTEAQLDPAQPPSPAPRLPLPKAVQLPITFMIDCDFDDLMRDNERISLASQITRSYSDNKNSPYRAHLAICSFGGQLRERFEKVLIHHKCWRGVRWLDESFDVAGERAKLWMQDEQKGGALDGVFSKYANLDEAGMAKLRHDGEIVYLSSEGDEDLIELKPYSTYIIGGLVDKNREKGICYKRATTKGIRTARLPIGEFLEMASRKVLATNHVNEIMVKWLECGDWGEAFIKVIPKRKGGVLKGQKQDDEEDPDVAELPNNEAEVLEEGGKTGDEIELATTSDTSGASDSKHLDTR